jgi:diguanylate cyclase (GGDEF)-like protein
MRILIADDDITSRTVLAGVLRNEGHEVKTAVDGGEALRALLTPGSPELVILDWMMPEIDGPEVVRRVRAIETERPPYILMVTARGEKADIIAGLDAGANDYLAKPFDPGELRARISVGRRMIEMQAALNASCEALAYHACHDPLTGLLNRRAILDRLNEELSRARRNSESLAVAMCDIDHFKKVNDAFGHLAGDDVLRSFAGILTDNLRLCDGVGRIGGEEFLVIAPFKAESEAVSLFSRLSRRVAEGEIQTRSGVLSFTISIGVSYTTGGCTADLALGVADSALYRAKREGRNRVVFDDHCISGLALLTDRPSGSV